VRESQDIEYTVDNAVMTGRLFLPEREGRRPGVLVAHEANGLSDHELERARRLAELGYVAFAVDYHGSARADSDAEMMVRLESLGGSPERMRAISRAALRVLTAQPRVDAARVAAVGFCFGAVMMLELARDQADLKAVVGFHPGSADHDPGDSRNITAAVLMCVGSEDPMMPAAQRLAFEEEMRAAGVDWQLNVYGGAKHSFTNPRSDQWGISEVGYHEAADIRSWRAMTGLFDEVFTPRAGHE
jgi:dienelactone hydrolase